MKKNEWEIVALAESVHNQYFDDITEPIVFECERGNDSVAVAARVLFQRPIKLTLFYGDDKVIEPSYRMGWVPVIAHELAHLIDPVNPDRVMAERLPENVMAVWQALREAGEAKCSIDGGKNDTRRG